MNTGTMPNALNADVRKPFTVFSVEVPNTETATSGPIRRFPREIGPMLSFNGCFTAHELFKRATTLWPDKPFMGERSVDAEGKAGPYVFETYGESSRRMDNFFSGLMHEGLMPTTPDNLRLLGIYLRNCTEWIIAAEACYAGRGASVPLYDTLGSDAVAYIIKQTELPTVVCGPKELERLAAAASECPSLKTAILVSHTLTDQQRRIAKEAGLKLYLFKDVERVGFRYPHPIMPPSPDDVATFSYTSGTTGEPKGALITHRNFMSVYASVKIVDVLEPDNDVHFSYLPLAHVYERAVYLGVIGTGSAMGFWRGSPDLLLEDMQALLPTSMPAVPRVLNRIYDKIMQGVQASSKLRQRIFWKAYAAKLRDLRTHKEVTRGFWDRLVFAKIRDRLGWSRLRIMCTGSAPLAPHVLDFMRVLTGCLVFEGYGQTETAALTSVTFAGDWTTGHVGGVPPVCEIKLVDVPEMGYLHTDREHGARNSKDGKPVPCVGRGEICVRGPHVFKGYYKMPDKTAEAIDEDGWLHSGDVGMFDPDGRLVIIDRKKNIFKLSQGEYVAAEKIENVLLQSPMMLQCFVYGDSLKSELIAIVVADPEAAGDWAKNNGLGDMSFEEICRQPLLREKLEEEIDMCARRAGLCGFEIPKAIFVESEPFSVDNGLLTPTQKLRRVAMRDRYQPIIDELYAQRAAVEQKRSRL